ncbi:MAG TPA: IPExxxVDY family protein [Flavobacteriaceae bacterium]|nr:IPExxxVDY family protein [Flavobacteriaceae bacterium]
MPRNKMILNLVVEDDYSLVAIHSSAEPYRLAFLLNKHLSLRLVREKKDIDFKHVEMIALYPLFRFFEPQKCFDYYLVSNKYKRNFKHNGSQEKLFQEEAFLTSYLMKEYKKVDFFLKIHDMEPPYLKNILLKLNKIPEIITAYTLETETLKSKENLIFN